MFDRLSRCLAAAAVSLFSLGAGAALAQSAPRTFNIAVSGLSQGLDVTLHVRRIACGATLDGDLFLDVPMLADTDYTFVPIVVLSRTLQLRVSVPVYRAAVDVPANPACPNKGADFMARIKGARTNGDPDFKQLHLMTATLVGDNVSVSLAPKAATLSASDQSNRLLSTLTRGVGHSVFAELSSPSESPNFVNSPSLALQYPAQPPRFPQPDVLVRFFTRTINNQRRACIEKDGRVDCEESIALGVTRPARLDGIECSFVNIQNGGRLGSQRTATAIFEFKLPSSFPIGQMEMSLSANDVDLATYTVGGVQRVLDLLPWRPLNLPIFIQ